MAKLDWRRARKHKPSADNHRMLDQVERQADRLLSPAVSAPPSAHQPRRAQRIRDAAVRSHDDANARPCLTCSVPHERITVTRSQLTSHGLTWIR